MLNVGHNGTCLLCPENDLAQGVVQYSVNAAGPEPMQVVERATAGGLLANKVACGMWSGVGWDFSTVTQFVNFGQNSSNVG